MEQGFPPLRRQPPAPAGLLDIISELVDGHADTVQLITGGERTELEWRAHCDYLRALQRLGRETLAHNDQRIPPPLGLAIVAGLTSAPRSKLDDRPRRLA